MKWVDHILEYKIDDKQFGGGVGTSTTARWLNLQIDAGPIWELFCLILRKRLI